jgi:aldose 1-epimerase
MTEPSCTQETFGALDDGRLVTRFTLDDGFGARASFLDFGATLQRWIVPDARGGYDDVVLGFDTFDGYRGPHPYFGGTVGRVANRIAHARFVLDGVTYALHANDGLHTLHGGRVGFDRRPWRATVAERDGGPKLQFTLTSRDGDEGFPGDVDVALNVTLRRGVLELVEEIRVSRRTPVALTAHPYFRLSGARDATILDHTLSVASELRLPVDSELIPTGERRNVGGSPFDLRHPVVLRDAITALRRGFDDCWLLRDGNGEPLPCASLYDPSSGRRMDVATTKPALQVYTGNFLDGSIVGKGGERYGQYAALCIEAQYAPNAVNAIAFESPMMSPEHPTRHVTRYAMTTQRIT